MATNSLQPPWLDSGSQRSASFGVAAVQDGSSIISGSASGTTTDWTQADWTSANTDTDQQRIGRFFFPEKHKIVLQQVIIETHIDFALNNSFLPLAYDRATRAHFRGVGARRAYSAFDLTALGGKGCANTMDTLHSLYFERFHPQRPIFWQQGFDSYSVSSVIFLCMVSIGCVFAGQGVSFYGSVLHDRLRALFIDWFSHGVAPDQGFLFLVFGWLVEMGELLFFPDRSGGLWELHRTLVSHARSLDVFRHTNLDALSLHWYLRYMCVPDVKSQQWLEHEMKKRVVLAIVQNDFYLAELYGTTPLIEQSEVKSSSPLFR